MKQIIPAILGSLFVFLIFLEILLRITGFAYKTIHGPANKIDGEYRILCIGESTTFGVGAKDPSIQSYPRQLEEMLRAKYTGVEIGVYYDETIGQNTSEISDKLPAYIKKYQPQMVIIMCGINNWWNLDQSNILLFNKNKYISDATLKTLIFLDKFRIWKLIKWARLTFGYYKHRWNSMYLYDYHPAMLFRRIGQEYGGMEIFYKLAYHDIKEMVKICKANNIEPIICNYPTGTDESIERLQRKIAAEFQLTFVDNDKRFKELPNSSRYFSKDGWHPNARGYKELSKNIYDAIVKSGTLSLYEQ